jgi:hypothetical protein
MTKPFDNLRDKMSEDQRFMADQLAQLQLDSIQRDKMLADMEEEVRTAMLRVQDAVITLRDYDGHYDRETETGDATELANLIDEVVEMLTSRNYEPTQEPEMMNNAKELVEKMEAFDDPLSMAARRNRIANEIMSSESFMWLMVGANHPESHCANLRNAWAAWKEAGGKSWGKREGINNDDTN